MSEAIPATATTMAATAASLAPLVRHQGGRCPAGARPAGGRPAGGRPFAVPAPAARLAGVRPFFLAGALAPGVRRGAVALRAPAGARARLTAALISSAGRGAMGAPTAWLTTLS